MNFWWFSQKEIVERLLIMAAVELFVKALFGNIFKKEAHQSCKKMNNHHSALLSRFIFFSLSLYIFENIDFILHQSSFLESPLIHLIILIHGHSLSQAKSLSLFFLIKTDWEQTGMTCSHEKSIGGCKNRTIVMRQSHSPQNLLHNSNKIMLWVKFKGFHCICLFYFLLLLLMPLYNPVAKVFLK